MDNYTKSEEAISRLSPEEFQVTQRSGTERPFENAYWDHDEPGTFSQLLLRLDLAIARAFVDDIFTDEVNVPPKKK